MIPSCVGRIAACLLLISAGIAVAGSVTVDHIDGLLQIGDTTYFRTGEPIVFYIRFTNDPEDGINVGGFTNGFEVGFPGGGSFTPVVATELLPDIWDSFFQLTHGIRYFSANGVGLDTVGTFGSKMSNIGMYSGFDSVVFSIETLIPAWEVRKAFCIDSCYFPPAGTWLWAPGGPPDWNGPICYNVYACCVGIRGNADGDPNDQINIGDLVYMVMYMFDGGPPPACMSEADFADDGLVDIQDLMTLVQYMFQGGPPPPPCP